MRKAKPIEAEPEQTSLAIFEPQNAIAVLTDSAKFETFYERIKSETDAFTPDLTTEGGRKAIASLAFKVVKTKTAIDAEGKRLTEEWRANVTKVDAARKVIRDRLDALRDQVRAPLTEWEAAEEARIKTVEAIIDSLRSSAIVMAHESVEDVRDRLANTLVRRIDRDIFQSHYEIAEGLRSHAVEALEAAIVRLLREEAERAELMQLRAEQEARIEREAVERAAKESLANIRAGLLMTCAYLGEREEQLAAEAARKKADIAAAAEAAKRAAQVEAEEAALVLRIATERAHAEALAAEKRRADEAVETQRAEAKRIADGIAEAAAIAEENARQQVARDKDRAHRSKVMAAAKEALMLVGVSEATAKSIVRAIVAEEIPNVRLTF